MSRLEDGLNGICAADILGLVVAEQSYGTSWRNRGGVGAFMMLARKWDRIETQAAKLNYDVFNDPKFFEKDGLADDIRDLRCYLTLVETELMLRAGDPQAKGYVDQD